jgi:hypothetical protein
MKQAMRFLKRRSQEEQLQADMAIFDSQGKGSAPSPERPCSTLHFS